MEDKDNSIYSNNFRASPGNVRSSTYELRKIKADVQRSVAFNNLRKRFPDLASDDLTKALIEAAGHGGKAVTILLEKGRIYTEKDQDQPSDDGVEARPVVDCLHKHVLAFPTQVAIFGIVIAHSTTYFLDPDSDHKRRVHIWLWFSGSIIMVSFIAEMLIRVAAQGEGSLCHWKTWKTFWTPWIHRFEFAFFIGLWYRLYVLVHITVHDENISAHDMSGHVELDATRLTSGLLIGYRIMRWMVDRMKVSIAEVRLFRHHYSSVETKKWQQDYLIEQQRRRETLIIRAQNLVDLWTIQAFMIFLIVIHTICYSVPLRFDEDGDNQTLNGMYTFSKPLGYVCIVLNGIELAVRYSAQGGEFFFVPNLNKLEVLFGMCGVYLLFYETWHSNAIRDGSNTERWHPSGGLTATMFIFHRICRAFGIYFSVTGDRYTGTSMFGASSAYFFMSKFDDVMEISAANVHVGLREVWITKAKLKPSGFEHLHLPLNVRDGFIENLYIQFPDIIAEHPILLLRLHNLLVLFGPGDGLPVDGNSSYWNYESVVEAKARLVELICKRLTPAKPKVAPIKSPDSFKEGGARYLGANMKHHVERIMDRLKQRIQTYAKNTYHRLEVNISNLNFQYEDIEGRLGQRTVTIGARLGSFWMHVDAGNFLQCDISRAGIYVEPFIKHEHATNARCNDKAWKEPLWDLLQMHPQSALEEIKRFNIVERLRMWAFDGLDEPLAGSKHAEEGRVPAGDMQRFRRVERWPEHRLVFSLLTAKIQAGTKSGLQHLQDEVEKLKADMAPTQHASGIQTLLKMGSKTMEAMRSHSSGNHDEDISLRVDATPEQWYWHINTGRSKTPVGVTIDYDQVQCLHTIASCVQDWFRMDNAFRWRPEMSLASSRVDETLGDEREGLARQWWIYAIHRVLAEKKIKPRIPWMDAWWQAYNAARYRAVLAELGPFPHKDRCMEVTWAKELQVRLPILSIMSCYKNMQSVGQFLDEPQKDAGMVNTVSSQISRNISGFLDISRSISGMASSRSSSDTQVEEPGRSSSKKSKKVKAKHHADLMARSFTGEHWLEEHDEHYAIAEPQQAQGGWSSSEGSTGHAAPVSLAGKWEMFLPFFEVHVLCPGPAPRPVIMHMKWSRIAADVLLTSRAERIREGVAEENEVLFAATITVGDFFVVCPQAGELLLGGSRYMVSVVRHLTLPPPLPGSKFIRSLRNEGQSFAFAFRAAAMPGKSGLAEMHFPHTRIVMYEPLIQELRKFTKKADENSRFDPDCLTSDRRIAFAMRPTRKKLISRVVQSDGGGGHMMRNGRFGPFLSASLFGAYTDDDKSADELQGWTALNADHIQEVRAVRRTVKKATAFRRKFEMASGFAGAIKEWKLDYYSGVFHVFQIGEFSDKVLLVEEYRLRNFTYDGSGGATEFQHARKLGFLPNRLVNFNFNGYSDAMQSGPQIDTSAHINEEGMTVMTSVRSRKSSTHTPKQGAGWAWPRFCSCTTSKEQVVHIEECEVLDTNLSVSAILPEGAAISDDRENSDNVGTRPVEGSLTMLFRAISRDTFATGWLNKESAIWREPNVWSASAGASGMRSC